jgi:hypothetical protein
LAPHWKYAYNLSNALYEVGNPIDSWDFIREAERLGLPSRYFHQLGELRGKIQLDLKKSHAYIEVKIEPASELVVTLDGEPFNPPFKKWIYRPSSTIVVSRKGFVTHEKELVHPIGERYTFEIRLELAPAMLIVTGNPPGATVRLDGTVIGTLPEVGPVPIAPGVHDVHAAVGGIHPESRKIELAAGQNAQITFELLKVEETGVARQTVGWITSSVGAAALIGGAVLLLVADDQAAELNRRNKDPVELGQVSYDVYREQFQQDKSRYEDFRMAGYISLGVGAAALITGVTLILWPESEAAELPDEDAPAPEGTQPPEGVRPMNDPPMPAPPPEEEDGITPGPMSFAPVPGGAVLFGGFTF